MVNVIGLGYIGLPTALIMAANGIKVVGTDYNKSLIEKLNNGVLTFKEEGLEEIFEKALNSGVKFGTEYTKTDMYIIAVPTPYNKISKKIDSSYVVSAINRVLDVCSTGAIIVIESTISPGTIDRFIRPIFNDRNFVLGKDVHLCHAPERIIPGNMLSELYYNNRTIGVDDIEIGLKVKEVYASFCKGEIIITDIRTAEMTKVVENTFRDVNIAFANELARICRQDNMDVHEIIRIANKHPRVNILSPGPGVGGHCIPVDPWFLVGDYPLITQIILKAREINDSMPEYVLERISMIMKENDITDLNKVGFYGLTYKDNVDDLRESPTLQMLEIMDKHLAGNNVKLYDPMIKEDVVINQYHDFDKFLDDIDLIVILCGHDELRNNLEKLSDKIIYDTKNVVNLEGVYKL